jgi:hypothetical protein
LAMEWEIWNLKAVEGKLVLVFHSGNRGLGARDSVARLAGREVTAQPG